MQQNQPYAHTFPPLPWWESDSTLSGISPGPILLQLWCSCHSSYGKGMRRCAGRLAVVLEKRDAPRSVETSVMLLDLAKNGFDIKHGRAVDGFDGTDSQTIFANVTNYHRMKTDRIGPVRRAR